MLTTLACLATAIYFEARGEPTLGQIAVGQVIYRGYMIRGIRTMYVMS